MRSIRFRCHRSVSLTVLLQSLKKMVFNCSTRSGTRLTEKNGDRLFVSGPVRIVVDAFDRTNMNREPGAGLVSTSSVIRFSRLMERRRPGFEEPRINILVQSTAARSRSDEGGVCSARVE